MTGRDSTAAGTIWKMSIPSVWNIAVEASVADPAVIALSNACPALSSAAPVLAHCWLSGSTNSWSTSPDNEPESAKTVDSAGAT